MRDKIDKVIEMFYRESDEYYSQYYYDENDTEYDIKIELIKLFDESGLKYSVEIEECYTSCGYDCSLLIIAWIENGELETMNVLLEYM